MSNPTDDELAEIAAYHWPGRPLAAIKAEMVIIRYTNYRGETADRLILPSGIHHDATKRHPECQWLLCAFDFDKRAWRDFALKDIASWRPWKADGIVEQVEGAIASGAADAVFEATREVQQAAKDALARSDRIDPEKLHRKVIVSPPVRSDADREAGRAGVEGAFKFAEDSRRDADKE